jgi:hypothetical protein
VSVVARRRRGWGRRVIRRRERIIALLCEDRWYTTTELAAICHVSRSTIRRDLRALEVPDDPGARRVLLRCRVIVRREYGVMCCESGCRGMRRIP